MCRLAAASVVFAFILTTPASNFAQSDGRTSRLAALGKVWLAAKFAHPRIALTERDWDAALVDVWPRLKSATTDAAFADAVGALLSGIGDPATRVDHGQPVRPTPRAPAIAHVGGISNQVLVLDLRGAALADATAWLSLVDKNEQDLKTASRLIVDLRGSAAAPGAAFTFESVNGVLVSDPTPLPSSRSVVHSGYQRPDGLTPFYFSQQSIEAAVLIAPRPGYGRREVVFLMDNQSFVPPIALALQARGSGVIAATDAGPRTPVGVRRIPLTGGYVAVVRVEDLVLGGKRVEMRVDGTVAADADDQVSWQRALKVLSTPRTPTGVDDPSPVVKPDLSYADTPYPEEPYRFIAALRLWGVFDYFFAYKHLLETPWESVLPEFLPKVLDAPDELAYARALAQMAARSHDSHVGLRGSRALDEFLGALPTPLDVRYIEGRPVVTGVQDAPIHDVQVGDEILSVDGEPMAVRARRIEEHIAFSTPAGRNRSVGGRLLSGPAGSTAKLVVRGADGKESEVSVQRLAQTVARPQRTGEVYRLLENNIGYADLERLNVADVPAMFERFAGALGIIFDMRGYPRGTAWAIAPRINTLKPAAAALFYRPLLAGGSATERLSFLQPLPPAATSVFQRPTAMLIDERAISQSEHTGLFFKAANATTFIGSQTTGANGDVTALVLPGGLQVGFSGHDVRWPDGRQLQRIGLVPDIEVKPTIAGIRAGRDEVLDRAVAFIRSQSAAASAR